LRIVSWLKENDQELPEGLARLYQSFLVSWHKREIIKDQESGTLPISSPDNILDLLSLLAFSMRASGLVSCDIAFVEKKLGGKLGATSVDEFLNRYAQGLILDYDKHYDSLRFSHETIQEYLTAEYLVAFQDYELPEKKIDLDSVSWSMPIVFAFELMDNPSETFLDSAWKTEPLLVSAAYRNSERLALLHISPGDNWTSGVLKAMRGDIVSSETQKLTHAARLPPKYSLPKSLCDTLGSMPFWYSIQNHPNGRERMDDLLDLIIGRRDIWCELIETICKGNPKLADRLEPSQALLISKNTVDEIDSIIVEASVVELSLLLRNKIISEQQFRKNWKSVLANAHSDNIEHDLIFLIRSNLIKLSQFNGAQKQALKRIGNSWDLSPRLLNLLARNGIVDKRSLREDPHRLDNLLSRMSTLNVERFVKSRILNEDDITPERLKILLRKIESDKDTDRLIKSGLISRDDIPENIIEVNSRMAQDSIDDISEILEFQEEQLRYSSLSEEQKLLEKIESDMQNSEKQKPGSGYHAQLAKYIEEAKVWPSEHKDRLVEISKKFFNKFASKKKKKEYMALVYELEGSV
jgi:hypothetical protein